MDLPKSIVIIFWITVIRNSELKFILMILPDFQIFFLAKLLSIQI